MLQNYRLSDQVIVESRSGSKLALFSDAGIHTSYWISVNRNKGSLAKSLRVFSIKAGFLFGRFSGVSLDYRNYTPYVQRVLRDLPVHLFTVNGEEEILRYLFMDNVKIVLTDENHFDLNGCPKTSGVLF